ncbi:DUF1156 domain-containing protein [Anaerolinea sp.]|uniref:DUF1156 domain-containing protein n=1 Tax=Anaerolinea sp. TaxID=1872519 RepID=UPI002ACEF63A|nr:DUF1156 domain-containing protein [Anaerolinea sp.]
MPKKLIEVSLPLEAINKESAREKSIRHGHPSTLHLWWARRPLAACRAVLWSSLVDDPSEYMPDEDSANRERERLFAILEDLVKWENSNNEEILDKARLEIARSVARNLGVPMPVGKQAVREFLATQVPPVLDPFAGGGSIPLEAQRLGLRAYASDLNPVAVLINKALIEIPPKFAGLPPVHPPEPGRRQESLLKKEWKSAEGLAEDVRFYGRWMRDTAEKRIGQFYPKAVITAELLAEREDLRRQGWKSGDELTVIAWLWARTVTCPNPACGASMPLVRSFALSTKKGKEAWVEPIVDRARKRVDFTVCAGNGTPPPPPKTGRGAQFRCLVCGQIAPEDAIRAEFKAKRYGAQLMAIVAEGKNGRVYLPPDEEHVRIAQSAKPAWIPEEEMNTETPNLVSGRGYGITHWHELFTPRQLTALTTFSDLVKEARERVLADARTAGDRDPEAYANAVATYLAFAVDKGANYWSSFCAWHSSRDIVVSTFARQALPMVWDYAEANPLSDSSGNFLLGVDQASEMLERVPALGNGIARQANAMENTFGEGIIISTDPPYYDNICYADLSDFFYVWLRYSLKDIYPSLFATMTVPKSDELVATPYRFDGDKRKAEEFFETGLRQAFKNFRYTDHPDFPTTVFYAFKQSESEEELEDNNQIFDVRASTGWETMLAGLIEAGFQITGTLPMRTELVTSLKKGINALATSVVLICRPRPENAPTATRREFLAALRRELPTALRELQKGNIAPVDLAQAAIGPGMAIFSRHKAVLEADGTPMRVRTALALINQALDEYLAEQEGEYDADTRWALAWFEQYGHEAGPYGVAETLSKAKNTSVEGLAQAGFLEARAGKVRLLPREELAPDWDPARDKRLTVWEATQYLIRALDKEGEQGAGALLAKLGAAGETARDLAYRLYTVCERKGWAQEALAYNMLVVAWPRIKEQAGKGTRQESLL